MHFIHSKTVRLLFLAAICISGAQFARAELYDWTYLAGQPGVSGTLNGPGLVARLNHPSGVAVDASGNAYVADADNNTIRKISPGGGVTTLAGTPGVGGLLNGTGSAARFNSPAGVAVDGSGNVYVADGGNRAIRKITSAGVVTTVAAGQAFAYPAALALDGSGNIYVADPGLSLIDEISPAGAVNVLAGTARVTGTADGGGSEAQFNYPSGIAVDGSGNIYVADSDNNTIRRIAPGGGVTTLAGMPGVSGTTDGNNATAQFSNPVGVAVDGRGNIYVADSNNQTIRHITPGGAVTTIGGTPRSFITQQGFGADARFTYLGGIAVTGQDNLYVADQSSDLIFLGTLLPPYTIPPTLISPASNTTVSDPITVTLTVPEPVLPGSVNLIFNNGSGTAVDLLVADAQLTTGTYSFNLDPANPTASPAIASGSSIPPGNYTVTFSYQDSQGAPAASVSATNVSISAVLTGTASAVNSYSAALAGLISPDFSSVGFQNVYFEWGTTGTYGETISAGVATFNINQPGGILVPEWISISAASYTASLTGLPRDTLIHYQFVATINGTTYYGGDQTFSTTHNDSPVTQPFYYFGKVKSGRAINLDVLANDSPGNPSNNLSITSISTPAGGIAQVSGSSIIYTPNGRYPGHDSFTYTVADLFGGTATGTVYLLNPYLAYVGNFQSIVTGSTPGYLTVSLGAKGSFTGSLKMSGGSYSFAGALGAMDPDNSPDVSGTAAVTIKRSDLPSVTLDLTLDAATGAFDYVLSDSGSGSFTQKILFSGVNPAPETGRYTVIIPPPVTGSNSRTQPQGTGWATMSVSTSGAVSITGKLADGTAFTAGSWLESVDGIADNAYAGSTQSFPVYANVNYPPAGYILGTMTFEDEPGISDFDGGLEWYKPTAAGDGFDLSTTMLGASYIEPASGYILSLKNISGNVVVSLGGNTQNTVTIAPLPAGNVSGSGGAMDSFHMALRPATGAFVGKFSPSGPHSKIKFGGVFFQKQNLGLGAFTTPGQNGDVTVTPQ